ncbi:MAG: efflux transporter outer membrane subunit [Azonexus sp.]|jgi:multidrug efflux system outer membrane protein
MSKRVLPIDLATPPLPTTSARRAALAMAFSGLLLGGCSVGPDYLRPSLDLPTAWTKPAGEATAAASLGERWWTLYQDPILDRLMDEALASNADLAMAAARVAEARANAGVAAAARLPSVWAQASRDRNKSSQLGSFPLPSGQPLTQTTHRATLEASYEVDLWGRYRRADEAARADLLASEAAQSAVRLSLTADVARQYFALLAATAQEAVARRTAATRGETLELQRRRMDAGLQSEYDLRQSEAEEAYARAQLASLVGERERAETTLALLLGRSPREVTAGILERGAPARLPEMVIPSGLPSDLLLRRPDLREAEEALVAANARIGVARAGYFPSVSLTAYAGSESVAFSRLFSGPAGIFSFAAALTQPIWNAGRVGFGVDAAEARRDQALARYRQAVASAFKDVRDALASQTASREALAAETTRAAALEHALVAVQKRFDAGIASRLEVLDVERNLLAAELARIDAERGRRSALADLFKALGGGWSPDQGPDGELSIRYDLGRRPDPS